MYFFDYPSTGTLAQYRFSHLAQRRRGRWPRGCGGGNAPSSFLHPSPPPSSTSPFAHFSRFPLLPLFPLPSVPVSPFSRFNGDDDPRRRQISTKTAILDENGDPQRRGRSSTTAIFRCNNEGPLVFVCSSSVHLYRCLSVCVILFICPIFFVHSGNRRRHLFATKPS